MTERQPWEPNLFPPGEEPDWVVGYEMTADGWRPIDAARDEEILREAEAEFERGELYAHEDVMAELRAMLDKRRSVTAACVGSVARPGNRA